LAQQVVLQLVSTTLGLNKHQGQALQQQGREDSKSPHRSRSKESTVSCEYHWSGGVRLYARPEDRGRGFPAAQHSSTCEVGSRVCRLVICGG
jgi:hypothetical protein